MSNGVNPLGVSPEMWAQATAALQSTGGHLTSDQVIGAIQAAAHDGQVTQQEATLALLLNDPSVALQMAAQLQRTHTIDPTTLHFDVGAMRANAPIVQQMLASAAGGAMVARGYVPQAQVNLDNLWNQAAFTHIGGAGDTMRLSTAQGRDAILRSYSQLMSSNHGGQACGAGSILALAVHNGAPGLRSLVATLQTDPRLRRDPELTRIAHALQAPEPQLSLNDLVYIQDMTFETIQRQQTTWDRQAHAPHDTSGGLRPQAVLRWVQSHHTDLAPALAGGDVMPIDNDGNGTLNHFVAIFGSDTNHPTGVWEGLPRTGGQLITDPRTIGQYTRAHVPPDDSVYARLPPPRDQHH